MTLGDIIRKKRIDSDLKQDAVAEYLGIGQSAYVKIEQGKTEVTINRLYKLAELFKCSVLEFIQLEQKDLAIIKEEIRYQGSTIEFYKGLYEAALKDKADAIKDKEAWKKEYEELKEKVSEKKTHKSGKGSSTFTVVTKPITKHKKVKSIL